MTQAQAAIGIEWISVLGMNPVDYAALAGALDVPYISIALAPNGENPHGYADWSLRDDAGLRADFKRALADHGVALSIAEGFLVMPGQAIDAYAADMDLLADMGVPKVNIASLDPDPDRAADSLSRFATMAQERGMAATLEFLPGLPLADLNAAQGALAKVAHPNVSLVIDAMHLFRTGGTVADLAAMPASTIGHIQICDVPMPERLTPEGIMPYHEEARYERGAPGDFALPLADMLRALPDGRIIGLEVPELAKARAGVAPAERLRRCVAATRALLAQLSD